MKSHAKKGMTYGKKAASFLALSAALLAFQGRTAAAISPSDGSYWLSLTPIAKMRTIAIAIDAIRVSNTACLYGVMHYFDGEPSRSARTYGKSVDAFYNTTKATYSQSAEAYARMITAYYKTNPKRQWVRIGYMVYCLQDRMPHDKCFASIR